MTRLFYASVTPLTEPSAFDTALSRLSDFRRQKALSYALPKDRMLSAGAGLLLDRALQEYGYRETAMRYGVTAHGKPFFENAPALHFSLSHSGEAVAVAVSDHAIGCDIQQITAVHPAVAARYFSPNELRQLNDADKSERVMLFFRLWTLKESVQKATGYGFGLPLSAFTVSVDPLSATGNDIPEDCHLSEYPAFEGYRLACCSVGVPPPEKAEMILL